MNYQGLELGRLTDKKVLFFVRIHGKKGIFDQYYPTALLNEFKSLKEFRTISEYPVGDEYIDLKKYTLSDMNNDDFQIIQSILDTNDLIYRCRGLRAISIEESRELIWICAKFFNEFFKNNRDLKVIVSLIIDNYVMSIMEAFARHYDVKMMQVIGFFIPGYYRLTDKGIGVPFRTPTEAEINKAYQRLTNKERSHYAISKGPALKRAFRDYISYRYRFVTRYLIKYKLKGDRSYESRFAPYFKGFQQLSKARISQYFNNLSEIKEDKSKLVFIPLHYHPEATVDYWTDDYFLADYLNSLLPIIAECRAKGFSVILKEHPGYYLRRSVDFYKTIKKINGVYLIDPFVSSQDVYDLVDNVVVYTGSAGLESIMIDKKVYTVSENYYSGNRLSTLSELGESNYPYYTEEEKKQLLSVILSSTIPLDGSNLSSSI